MPKTQFLRKRTHFSFLKKVGEHNFMGEQRNPFKSCRPVGISAADQFVLAVGVFDKFGRAKFPDHALAVTLGKKMFQFHTRPSYGRGETSVVQVKYSNGHNQAEGNRCRIVITAWQRYKIAVSNWSPRYRQTALA